MSLPDSGTSAMVLAETGTYNTVAAYYSARSERITYSLTVRVR